MSSNDLIKYSENRDKPSETLNNLLDYLNKIDKHLSELQMLAMQMNQWRRHRFMQHITYARHELKKLRLEIIKQELLQKLGDSY